MAHTVFLLDSAVIQGRHMHKWLGPRPSPSLLKLKDNFMIFHKNKVWIYMIVILLLDTECRA